MLLTDMTCFEAILDDNHAHGDMDESMFQTDVTCFDKESKFACAFAHLDKSQQRSFLPASQSCLGFNLNLVEHARQE